MSKLETATSEDEVDTVHREFLSSYPFTDYQKILSQFGLFKFPEPVKFSLKELLSGKPENPLKPYKKTFILWDGAQSNGRVTCYSTHPIPGPGVEKIIEKK